MKKNMSIELTRIIAIILVITLHLCSLNFYHIKPYAPYSFVFASISKICVPLFLLIMGYLYDPKKDIKKIYKKNLYRIIIPSIIFYFIYQLFGGFFMNKYSILESIKDTDININHIFISKILLTDSFHLWYILVISVIYILYPIIKILSKPKNKKYKYMIAFILFCIFILFRSYSLIISKPYPYVLNNKVIYGFIAFLIGNAINEQKDKIKLNKYIYLIMYFIFMILSFAIFFMFEKKLEHPYYFLYSLDGSFITMILASISLFMFMIKLNIKNNELIEFLGDKTLGIFYIHLIFVNLLAYRVRNIFINPITTIIYILIIYIICLIIVSIYKFIIKNIKNII